MIYQFSPFLNENLIASISAKESRKYGGAIFLTESTRDFHNRPKPANYRADGNENIRYRYLNVDKLFLSDNLLGRIRLFPNRFSKNPYVNRTLRTHTWYNESVQRNMAARVDGLEIQDDDIVVLCDVDEIIDSRKIDLVVQEARKHGIVTGKLHFTLFFFDLFSRNWGGPKDYSYRLFAMTGAYFKNMSISSDELRKMGEHEELEGKIHLIDDFIGFHHSWLGDEAFVKNKIQSYAHVGEHKGLDGIDYIRDCIRNHQSIFPGHILEVDHSIDLMDSVKELRQKDSYKGFFCEE